MCGLSFTRSDRLAAHKRKCTAMIRQDPQPIDPSSSNQNEDERQVANTVLQSQTDRSACAIISSNYPELPSVKVTCGAITNPLFPDSLATKQTELVARDQTVPNSQMCGNEEKKGLAASASKQGVPSGPYCQSNSFEDLKEHKQQDNAITLPGSLIIFHI